MAVLCPELSGRESEVRTLMTAFDAAGRRRAGALLCGEAGVGRTRLAREATAPASESGWAVVTARAVESARRVPQGSADVLTRILASCDGLPFAAKEVLATAVSSGELVLDEAGCT